MKFLLNKPQRNVYNLLRELGYRFQKKEKEELVFIHWLGPTDYPRFHLYLKMNENLEFNLHLDQKRPTYKGVPAHCAEYEGKVVEKEVERIKQKFLLHPGP